MVNFDEMEEFWEHTYYNTYYYSNIIDNILTGDIELIGFISDYFNENYSFLIPFEKYSAFHKFIEYIIYRFVYEDMNEHDEKAFKFYERDGIEFRLYVEKLLSVYGIGSSFDWESKEGSKLKYEDIEAYHNSIIESGELEMLCKQIAHEVFYILFNNRDLLIRFNQIVAGYVVDMDKDMFDEYDVNEYWPLFRQRGKLRRVNIPEWCKEAVFFREKGRCCLCGTDITALLRTGNQKHYDHMVPLFYGGINDVSNIQLLCSACNLKKGRKDIETSAFYFKWYE